MLVDGPHALERFHVCHQGASPPPPTASAGLTPRRSQSPVEILLIWAQRVLRRKIFEWTPALGRALNVPLGASFAGDFADKVLEDQIELLAIAPEDLDEAMIVLRPAMRNDAGEVSTYPQGVSRLRSLLLRIDHCTITGHTMMVLDKSGGRVLTHQTGPVDWEKAQPRRLKPRPAPAGACYTLTCQGDFALFFRQDVLPLLHFLDKYGPRLGPLHIVTRPDFPGFVMETLRAICGAWPGVEILELLATERLENVSALWLSRTPDASDWAPVTRAEADALAALLRAHHKIPPATEADGLLFVSRGDAKVGALVNEAEVLAELLDYGFDFLAPRPEDHKTTIEAFQSARIVVAAHGEALTNLLFCRPGTLVIELFASNQIRSDYCWLALRLGLRYRAVRGFQGDALQAFSVKVHEVMAQVAAELGPLEEDEEEDETGEEAADES